MKAQPQRRRKCLHCRSDARVRGLCQTHYQAARRAIGRGEVSDWGELEAAGLARENRQGQRGPPNKLREKIKRLKTTKGKP